MLWLTGGALAVCLGMIAGLLLWVLWNGMATFRPLPVVRLELLDGTVYLGEITRHEDYVLAAADGAAGDEADDPLAVADRQLLAGRAQASASRRLVRTGNYELTLSHFHFVSDHHIKPGGETRPEWAVVVERVEWGRFYGEPTEFRRTHRRVVPAEEASLQEFLAFFAQHRGRIEQWDAARRAALDQALEELDGELRRIRRRNIEQFLQSFGPADGVALSAVLEDGRTVAAGAIDAAHNVAAVQEVWRGAAAAWEQFSRHHRAARKRFAQLRELNKRSVGGVHRRLEEARLGVKAQESATGRELLTLAAEILARNLEHASLQQQREQDSLLVKRLERHFSQKGPLPAAAREIVAALAAETATRANELVAERAQFEARLAAAPQASREAVQTLLDAEAWAGEENARIAAQIDVLRRQNESETLEFLTAQGQNQSLSLADIVRAYPANRLGWAGSLAVYLERWREFLWEDPREANSEGGVFPAIWGTVAMTLIMSLAVVPFGVLAALYLREYARSGPVVSAVRIAINNLAGVPSIVFGVFGLGFFCYILGVKIDELFYAASLPNPTYGKGGLLWASLTLALMTLPVVIVATEEALAAVPNSMREGSYACGASKWQTIQRIVLPRALPGILTGMILAMARGAGEVAPLMLVGAVKLAPELPVDLSDWSGSLGPLPTGPVHASRSFMHLGFHIYDLGFQSANSEAAKPMVYTTTLLLIVIIAALNLTAVWLRTRLRRRYRSSQF